MNLLPFMRLVGQWLLAHIVAVFVRSVPSLIGGHWLQCHRPHSSGRWVCIVQCVCWDSRTWLIHISIVEWDEMRHRVHHVTTLNLDLKICKLCFLDLMSCLLGAHNSQSSDSACWPASKERIKNQMMMKLWQAPLNKVCYTQ